jgi:serine protease Do
MPTSSDSEPDPAAENFLRDYFEGIQRPAALPSAEEPISLKDKASNELPEAQAPQAADEPVSIQATAESRTQPADISGQQTPATPAPAAPLPLRPNAHPLHLATSTLLSLLMVFALLLAARFVVPPLVESTRYGWYRGQLRAEYELSGQRLRNVSLDSLAEVSQLVSQRVGPSVVHINLLRDEDTLSHLQAILGAEHPGNLRLEGQGSGFIIDPEGFVLTNQHVVEGVGRIEITLSDGRRVPAEIVGADPMTDLAVLRIKAQGLMAIDWGDSDDIVVGTPVWAAGSPFGLQQTVTFGIISGKHRVDFRGTRYEESVRGGTAYGDMMQSDVALNPGNSGGPLVNSMGEVVGVNAAILGETYRGISFSIPSKVAQRVAASLIADGQVARGWLGVRMEDLAENERFDAAGNRLPGVRVKGFPMSFPSPAQRAGVAINDVIIEFQSQPVMNQIELMKLIGETEVGSPARIVVLRDDQRLEFDVVLGKRETGIR